MKVNVADIRTDYKKEKLNIHEVNENPIVQFENWLQQALNAEIPEATSMIVSTVDKQGLPASRVVLLKGIENGSFIFYTNYDSRKGKQIAANPNLAITFFWPQLERQVNIVGTAAKVADEVSDQYFSSRPRKSQLGAWTSDQSTSIPSRTFLKRKFMTYALKYLGKKVARPPHWGGYAVTPTRIEFWQGRPSRLHDRIQYARKDDNLWTIERLSP